MTQDPDRPATQPVAPSVVPGAREGTGERLRRIESVTDVALSKLGVDELLDELLARVREVLDVDTAAALLVDDSGQFLTAVAASGLEEEVRQGVRIPIGRGFAGRVAATARAVVLDDVTPTSVVNPILMQKQLRSLVGVPLLDRDRVLGVLHVGKLTPYHFSEDDVALLQLAADRVAGAIAARRAYLDRAAAVALQRSLAPHALPPVAGYALAARYVPGSHDGVSGDWYDVFTLPDGKIGIVVGDVMGHGLRAATVMGRLKSALRAYSLEHEDPGVVLDLLDRKIQHFEPGQMATVFYGVLDVPSGRLHYCSAGHLPPVAARPMSWSRLVEHAAAVPLGVLPEPKRPVHEFVLDRGDMLCLFTDGLLDHQRGDPDTELRAVTSALRTAPLDAEGACMRLMATMVDQRQPSDDVTLLVVRRES